MHWWWRKTKLQEFNNTAYEVLAELARSPVALNPVQLTKLTGRRKLFVQGSLQSLYDMGFIISDRPVTQWELTGYEIVFSITPSGRKNLKLRQEELMAKAS